GASTSTEIKTLFQLEDGAQAVTQIFGTLQTETVAVNSTAAQTRGTGTGIHTNGGTSSDTIRIDRRNRAVKLVVLVAVAGIQDTVQRHGRFCLSNASGGKAGQQSRSEQSLFHGRNLRRFV